MSKTSCGDPWVFSYQRVEEVPAGEQYENVFKMLEARIDALEDELMMDRALRDRYPALQDLYDKYKVTKELVASYHKDE